MSEVSGAQTMVIDLRGNPGGSLHAAIDSAALFLEQNRKIVGIKTHGGIKEYRSESPQTYIAPPLYLWQDEQTASAAEVFIAALTEHQRAVSIGRKTFGKGKVQEIITLADGSALYLTIGEMQTPNGVFYHERGLEPTYPLEARPAQTEDYLVKVRTLMQQTTPSASSSPSPGR
jgi:carboxyl-terminal processing protease